MTLNVPATLAILITISVRTIVTSRRITGEMNARTAEMTARTAAMCAARNPPKEAP